MDETTIVILAVAMFVCMILIAGGGYYYTTTLEEVEGDTQGKKSGYCDGMDVNGVYEYNDEGECVFKKCKNGYINQGGYCIPQRDYEADFDAGYIPVNCEISKYNEGPCVNENGRQLTGEPGRCGTGVKRFMTDPDSFTMANSLGECDNFSYTEACEVPCETVACGARDENYTKTDGVCRGFDGNPIGGDTNRCGTGYQIYEVDPATAGNFETDELRDAWIAENWKDCTPIKKSCDVICEPGMEPSGCKALGNDTEVSWVEDAYGEKACIPKEEAVALLKGDAVYNSVSMPMKKLTRAAAQNEGITSMDKLPEGYSIRYKSGVVDFKDFTRKGCATAELVPCKQPTEDQDCQTEWVPLQSCYDVGCGKPKQMKVVNTIINHAWGMGGECNANVGEEKVVDCEQATVKPCCSPDNDAHWTEPIGGYTCSENGTYNLVNTSACSTTGMDNPPTRTKNCCYVGDWEKGECVGDGYHNMSYTRTVVNGELCTDRNDRSTEKQEPNEAECYSKCEVEQIGGHAGPYEMVSGFCQGNFTYKVTKAGKGMGLWDPSCTTTGAANRPVDQMYTYRKAISGKNVPCPA